MTFERRKILFVCDMLFLACVTHGGDASSSLLLSLS